MKDLHTITPGDFGDVEVVKILPDKNTGRFYVNLWWKSEDDDRLFAPDGSGHAETLPAAIAAAFDNLKRNQE